MKHHEHLEAKRLNKDTERGMNMYVNSIAKFRDGALTLSKKGLSDMEGKSGGFNKESGKSKQNKEFKKSFEQIEKERVSNPEFMTGKRFRKKKGNVGKKFKGGKRRKR